VDFTEFALSQLPPPPARVLEVGCGPTGGITPALADAGYDVEAIDPRAPSGDRFRRGVLAEIRDERFDAVVAERVFHHVHPLDAAFDQLARMTRLVVLDEFAWNRIDARTTDWYEGQHRVLRAAGREPTGPPDLAEWRAAHAGLIPSEMLLRIARARFSERLYEPRPYFYRWLNGPATAALEKSLIDARAIEPIGFRWVGVSG
jgi:SAM-dependent methyltransferase